MTNDFKPVFDDRLDQVFDTLERIQITGVVCHSALLSMLAVGHGVVIDTHQALKFSGLEHMKPADRWVYIFKNSDGKLVTMGMVEREDLPHGTLLSKAGVTRGG